MPKWLIYGTEPFLIDKRNYVNNSGCEFHFYQPADFYKNEFPLSLFSQIGRASCRERVFRAV